MLFYEWSQTLNYRKGLMVSAKAKQVLETTHHDPGYFSIYGYSKEDADIIATMGHSRGFKNFTPVASSLTIDLDDGDATLPQAIKTLVAKGLAFSVYFSGGKGYHIVIPHTQIASKDLPYSHKLAVKDLGIPSDNSLYSPSRLLSSVNRKHPKTGKRKVKIFEAFGKDLEMTITAQPKHTLDIQEGQESPAAALMSVAELFAFPPTKGNRHMAFWRTAKRLAEAGISHSTATDLLLKANETWDDAKTEAEVMAPINSAYGAKNA